MLKHIITPLFILFIVYTQAQQTEIYTHDNVTYNKALSLYQQEQYQAAQPLFEMASKQTYSALITSDCAYYNAICAVQLNQANASVLVNDFVKNYPTSTKINQAYNAVANYYFTNSKYSYALKWFEKVDEKAITPKEKDAFYFKKGYALFSTQQKKKAKKYFNKVSYSETYGAQAKYYLGFIAYQGDDYKEASSYFDQVKNKEKYQEKMAYFQADMNFKLGNFDKAIDLASQQLPLAADIEEHSQLNKIIGESFFNLKKYDQALPYLKDYKGKKGKWSNTDHYQLGYVFYQRKEYTAAISEFNKIINGSNAIAQNAYYHLAQCYLETNKKQEALNAFKNASEMNFDTKIKEDAALNYAKLSYEIGNPYQSVPEVLMTYIKTYPKSTEKENIENLLIDSYITSKNYKKALELLEGKSGFDYKVAYQKVAFYRGINLYNEGLYNQAKTLFQKAVSQPKTPSFTARANYWIAECDYVLGNYADAIVGYKLFALQENLSNFTEAKNLDYQIAYAYFKQKEYTNAIPYFKNFITKNTDDKQRINDSYLRLGDSYFVTMDYWKAMESYNIAKNLKGIDADYAHFQKAISYGFVGKNQEKISDLNLFLKNYPTSKYQDDALFELGNTYVLVNNNEKALAAYGKLIRNFPKSSYVSRSMLKEGLIYYNTDANEQALNKFRQVAKLFPGSAEANQAVATARLIYVDLDRVSEYVTWVKTLDFVEVSNADVDNTTYEAAEKQYLANNTNAAISSFSKYLTLFPNGIHATQAHFYIAQLKFKKGKKEATIPHYTYVINKERNEFTEQALARLAQVYLEQKDWIQAKPILTRLEQEADFKQNIIFAQSNLMKVNFELKNYANAVLYAEKVLENPKIQDAIKSDAQVIIARSAMQTGDEAKAKIAYAKVKEIAKGSLAAEALYYDAYFTYKDGQYADSNTKIQQLTKNYSGYKYYAAKSLVLMAKNFYAQDDAYQATYILERVIENFSVYEDIKQEAQTELKLIKAKEAKRNSSINIEEETNPETTPQD